MMENMKVGEMNKMDADRYRIAELGQYWLEWTKKKRSEKGKHAYERGENG